MIRFTRSVQLYQDAEGKNPDEAAPVRVLIFGTATEATIFSDDAGTIPLAQPFLTNLLSQENPGQFTFVVSDGTYDIEVNGVIALASEQIFSQAVIPVIPVLPDIDIDNIRYSKLQNPLLRILKKNKLEDVIAGSLTWTRSTTATYVDRYGIIQTAAINEPRQEVAGWLIEGASQNLCLRAEEFDNATWVKSSLSVIADSIQSPDGLSTGDSLDAASTGSLSPSINQQIVSVTSNAYTFSFFAKKNENDFVQITFSSGHVSGNPRVNFDLSLGIIGSSDSGITPKIESLSNGWFRCSASVIAVGTALNSFISLVKSNTDTRVQANSWISGDGIYSWGAQVDELPFASSYIPTVASSIPRAIEPVIAPIDNNAPLFEDPFSLIVKFTVDSMTHSDIRSIAHISSGSNLSLGHSIFIAPSGLLTTYVRSSVTNTALSVTPGVEMTIVLTFDGTDATLYINGVAEINPAVGTLTGKPLRIGVGTQDLGAARALFGNINTFKIKDSALNADEVKFIS